MIHQDVNVRYLKWDVICASYVTVRRPYVLLGRIRRDDDTLGCDCKVS